MCLDTLWQSPVLDCNSKWTQVNTSLTECDVLIQLAGSEQNRFIFSAESMRLHATVTVWEIFYRYCNSAVTDSYHQVKLEA
ncbi:uncharacterized protein LOC117718228 isoform X2 [Arvicanthis niloticus]|uniref:uncharacterized protein LOC117718228 isoform X2 n=1 Tax=Arvicanthis niloticus TaxID=61156 RepID=UPI00402B8535